MSSPFDRSNVHLRAMDDLGSIALGEIPEPLLAAHLDECPECHDELASLRRVVELAHIGARDDDVETPPARVWDQIAAETAGPSTTVLPIRRPARTRRYLVATVAAAVVLGAGAGGWAVGHRSAGPTVARASEAPLAAQPGTSDDAHGLATVHRSPAGYQLEVKAFKLPAHGGYYEVWLYNPDVQRMVAVGTLGTGGRGTFTVPGGLDLREYRVIDVSAQKYDGNPAHDRSVLRGPLSS